MQLAHLPSKGRKESLQQHALSQAPTLAIDVASVQHQLEFQFSSVSENNQKKWSPPSLLYFAFFFHEEYMAWRATVN